MATSGYKSISRVDHEKKHAYGWFVRVAYRSKMYQKFFSDLAEGGKRKALKAAIKWRDKTERKLGKPRTERKVAMPSSRNTSGVVGIRETTKAMTRDGRKKGPVYEVWWFPKPGEIRKTSVSIYKYGQREAFRRAQALRKAGEKIMYGSELSSIKKVGLKKSIKRKPSRKRRK
ncbi:AP2 domain-containing protein [bacterium]|nr:AP2 domain-containing protein [bacterium]MCI0607214.1 AP2 domain-containing protein [bacterium]